MYRLDKPDPGCGAGKSRSWFPSDTIYGTRLAIGVIWSRKMSHSAEYPRAYEMSPMCTTAWPANPDACTSAATSRLVFSDGGFAYTFAAVSRGC